MSATAASSSLKALTCSCSNFIDGSSQADPLLPVAVIVTIGRERFGPTRRENVADLVILIPLPVMRLQCLEACSVVQVSSTQLSCFRRPCWFLCLSRCIVIVAARSSSSSTHGHHIEEL
ncbi:unnamed protein product [Linum trigynum]|uniref:Secreted protein n=1 Tax=Linum trigynum TaxID=586398 RepID=A0AAV2CVC9_9ROSI